ncbi:MAG: hypothetical protein Q9202_002500 [Teloschistes flavicans]
MPDRRHGSARSSNPDIFSDEYALDSMQTSDSIQPAASNLDPTDPVPHDVPSTALTGIPVPEDPDQEVSPMRRSLGSMKRPFSQRRSSLLSHLNSIRQYHHHGTQASLLSDDRSESMLYRSTSRASTASMPRGQSPYQGPTGPSHPYGSYPQDTAFIRTPSSVTSSTVRPRERSYPSGPTQPYAMYSQNTMPENDTDPAQRLHAPLSFGFPGQPQNYRRPLGPDAADADDLVGPDGYLEQLPPYSRWPDNVPPKNGAPGPASILSAERGHIGASDETLMNPFQSRSSLPQHVNHDRSSTSLTAVASSPSPSEDKDEGSFKERIKEKGRKRTCFGKIPLWLIAILVLLIIAVLAGTLGGVVGHARAEQKAAPTPTQEEHPSPPASAESVVATVTMTSLVDATPLPSTPTNLPSLPTGAFYVPLRNLSTSQNSCLSSYQMAWDCSNSADLKIDLSLPQMISVSPLRPAPVNVVRFGPQPPSLDEPIPLMLMGDRDRMADGPAWWAQHVYTKTVVVPGINFNADNSIPGPTLEKRWGSYGHESGGSIRIGTSGHRSVAQPGDQPWFCYWNSTILEIFIYVTQNSSGQTQLIGSGLAAASSTSVDWQSPAVPTSSLRRRQNVDPSQLAGYSKDIKIEERRSPTPTDPSPYCVQMQIMNDNSAQELPPNASGRRQIITLTETAPSNSMRMHKRSDLWERDDSTNACQCEWVNS